MDDERPWFWWGLARRRIASEEVRPTRLELATLCLLVALALDLLWLVLLATGPTQKALVARAGLLAASLYIPVGIAGVMLVVGCLLPLSALETTTVPAIVALARERGWLADWDRALAILSSVALLLGAFRLSGFVHWPCVVVVCLLTIVCAFALGLFTAAPLTARKWRLTLPSWLEELDRQQTQARREAHSQEGDELKPEEGAEPLYGFLPLGAAENREYPVGVRIDPAVLQELRSLNQAADGRLFLQNPLGAVLSQGDPVRGVGADEVNRLCLQMARIVRKSRLTRYQQASSILRMVQRAIQYQLDETSTQKILGRSFEEYGRFPLETVADQVGDCDCTAILAAALLARSGFPCALLLVELAPGEWHMAVGLEVTSDLMLRELDMGEGAVAFGGSVYLYGETATDDPEPLGFGAVPLQYRATMRVKAEGSARIPVPAS
jgi:predicted transglutaminase-like cysteine proteinase